MNDKENVGFIRKKVIDIFINFKVLNKIIFISFKYGHVPRKQGRATLKHLNKHAKLHNFKIKHM